jgi:ubiquinone/menaquinone biosynthesis C-methylase UbiE
MTPTRIDSSALARVYGDGAETYDAVWSPVIQPGAVAVIDAMQLRATSHVLDVGAGTGALTDTLRIAAPAASIVSLDPAPAMLRVALELRHATGLVADAAALPLPPSSVDAVLLAYVLFHLLDPLAGLREAARVVRAGGRVGTVTWTSESAYPAAQVWDQTLAELDVPMPPAHGNHQGLDTYDAIERLIDDANLRPLRIWTHELHHTFTPDEFWTLRTGTGCNRARLAALDDTSRERVLPEVRRRLDRLTATDYTFRGAVICSVSEKRRT